jgi:superoxide dismutase, Fe-Mn family
MRALKKYLLFFVVILSSSQLLQAIQVQPPYEPDYRLLTSNVASAILDTSKHFKIYESYVDEVNRRLALLRYEEAKSSPNIILVDALRDNLSPVFNGMILHEFYFGNIGQPTISSQEPGTRFNDVFDRDFGGYEKWREDFADGAKQGVGWMLLVSDTQRPPHSADPLRRLLNVFVAGNDLFLISGYQVIIALDMWEHAYVHSGNPPSIETRDNYIKAFLNNINWDNARNRYTLACQCGVTVPNPPPPGFTACSYF